MRIVVLLRRLRAKPGVAASSGPLGDCDRAALTTALALRAERPESQVTALAAGPANLEDQALAYALACGADRAVRVFEPGLEAGDFLAIARVLAAATRRLGFDLVLAGDHSDDELQGAMAPAAAELLASPHLTGVRALRFEATQASEGAPRSEPAALLAVRRDPGVLRTLRVPLPAVLGISALAGAPPVSAAVASARAGASAIEHLDLAALELHLAELKHRDRCLGRLVSARKRHSRVLMTDPADLVARLRRDQII